VTLVNAPLLFAFCFIMVVVNMLFCLIGGKLFGFIETARTDVPAHGAGTYAAAAVGCQRHKIAFDSVFAGKLPYFVFSSRMVIPAAEKFSHFKKAHSAVIF